MQTLLPVLTRLVFSLTTLAIVPIWTTAAHASAITIGDYYQESSANRRSTAPPASSNCNDGVHCYWMFNVVPAGKQLVVTEVSCQITVGGNSADNLFNARVMSQANGAITDRMHFFQPVNVGQVAAARVYVIRGSTMQLFKAGERPLVLVSAEQGGTGSTFSGNCGIGGRIGNPPP